MIDTTILDTTPRGLADALDALATGLLERDRETAHILCQARESLRALAWNRYARTAGRRSAARTLRTRHQRRRGSRHA